MNTRSSTILHEEIVQEAGDLCLGSPVNLNLPVFERFAKALAKYDLQKLSGQVRLTVKAIAKMFNVNYKTLLR